MLRCTRATLSVSWSTEPNSLMRRSLVVFVIALTALPWSAAGASAHDGTYHIVFPVAGDNNYTDTWGAPRSGGRTHEGTDIMADKMVPVVAAAAGTIGWVHDGQDGRTCCALALEHDDGYASWYIHLNNDTPGTDDGLAIGIADGITTGVHVEAGQLLGWVGDSGNAEGSGSHLHFEIHDPNGTPFNPYPSLVEAEAGNINSEPKLPTTPANADGVALHDPTSGYWHVRYQDGTINSFYFGNPEDIPYSGDWNGDGITTLGLYRVSAGFLFLRNSNTQGIADINIFYGDPGDLPIAGDWDGDGIDTVGIFRPSDEQFYLRNTNTQGNADLEPIAFGQAGDVPVAGDWNGDGYDTIGVYRPSTRMLLLTNSLTDPTIDIEFEYLGANDGDKILTGDWDGDGVDTVGVFRPSLGEFYLRDTFTQEHANITITWGESYMSPVSGDWGE